MEGGKKMLRGVKNTLEPPACGAPLQYNTTVQYNTALRRRNIYFYPGGTSPGAAIIHLVFFKKHTIQHT
jgi:hypothetical protein